ncbi:hypothetical protein [Kribbella qitaiheensis]|uniref:hypothetical protein n=1 Tax=Kribbella qitaiheensis TaxID=1544730 RepID=UPI0016264DD0|nr:hypothetical protein [Kribbella qitaiheensis]
MFGAEVSGDVLRLARVSVSSGVLRWCFGAEVSGDVLRWCLEQRSAATYCGWLG